MEVKVSEGHLKVLIQVNLNLVNGIHRSCDRGFLDPDQQKLWRLASEEDRGRHRGPASHVTPLIYHIAILVGHMKPLLSQSWPPSPSFDTPFSLSRPLRHQRLLHLPSPLSHYPAPPSPPPFPAQAAAVSESHGSPVHVPAPLCDSMGCERGIIFIAVAGAHFAPLMRSLTMPRVINACFVSASCFS